MFFRRISLLKLVPLALAAAALFCLATCSKGTAISSAADLDGKRIGVKGGTTGEAWVQENVKDAQVFSFASGTDAALDLKNGAIDAVVFDELPSRDIVAQNSDLMIVRGAGSFFREEYGIAVQKGNTELLGAVNAAIEKIKASGEYDLLYSSFIAPPDGKMTIPSFDIPAGEGTLRLGTDPGYPPFGYVEGNEIVGFDVSLGQLIGRELGVNIEVVGKTFAALIPALEAGEIDLIAASMTITEERQKIIDFSVPYFATEQVIIVKK